MASWKEDNMILKESEGKGYTSDDRREIGHNKWTMGEWKYAIRHADDNLEKLIHLHTIAYHAWASEFEKGNDDEMLSDMEYMTEDALSKYMDRNGLK